MISDFFTSLPDFERLFISKKIQKYSEHQCRMQKFPMVTRITLMKSCGHSKDTKKGILQKCDEVGTLYPVFTTKR